MNKHSTELLEKHFDTAFTAPDGINKLRELILTLAMQGKLVPQAPNEQPASELLLEIEAEKQQLVKEGKIKQPKPLPPVIESEKPYMLPREWEWVRLGTIGQTQTGTTPKSGDHSSYGSDVPFIKPADIAADRVDYMNEGMSNSGVEKYGRLAPAGSSLMVCIGTIGKTSIIDRACSFNQQINAISPFSRVCPPYLQQFLRSSYFQDECWKQSSSTTIAILNKGKWESIPVAIPPFAEQLRIVAKIDELMARCDELEKLRTTQRKARLTVHAAAIKQLLNIAEPGQHQRAQAFLAEHFGELYTVKENVAELRKAILQLAVMGKLVPQNPSDPSASELLKEIEAEKQRLVKEGTIKKPKPLPQVMEDEKLYALPQGWEWVRLGELGITQTGTTPPSKDRENYGDHIPFIGPGDIKNNGIDYSGDGLSERGLLKGRLIDEKSVLMVCIGGSIGKHAIADQDITCNQQINTLTPYKPTSEKYFFHIMASAYFQNAVISQAGGSATPIINKQKWSRIPVPLASVSEQHRIVARIDQLMALCDTLDQQIYSATAKQAELLGAVIARV